MKLRLCSGQRLLSDGSEGCVTRTPVPSFTRSWNLENMKLRDELHLNLLPFLFVETAALMFL